MKGLVPFFIMAGLLFGGLPLIATYRQHTGEIPADILFPALIIFTAVTVLSLGLLFPPKCNEGEEK